MKRATKTMLAGYLTLVSLVAAWVAIGISVYVLMR